MSQDWLENTFKIANLFVCCREVLKKFYIGELDTAMSKIQAFRADFGEEAKDKEFYDDVKARVNKLFKDLKVTSSHMM